MQCLGLGIPIVNTAGPWLHTRLAAGFCKVAGVPGCTAENIDDFLQLATNQERLKTTMGGLALHELYSDLKPVRALEDYLHCTLSA